MKLLEDGTLGAARTSTARTARSRRTREALVAAVRDELRQHGSFTAETVADRAACSPATFYGHFATKDDALAAAFEIVLLEMLDILRSDLTNEALASDERATIDRFVERQAGFFATESLVFRTALSRLPAHRVLRQLYREAELVALDTLETLFRTRGHTNDQSALLAEQFLVVSQGLNNPRTLRPGADGVRSTFAAALTSIMITEPTSP